MNLIALLGYIVSLAIIIVLIIAFTEASQGADFPILTLISFMYVFWVVVILSILLSVFILLERLIRKKCNSESKLLTRWQQSKIYRTVYYLGQALFWIPSIGCLLLLIIVACSR